MPRPPVEVPREPFLVDLFHHWQRSPRAIVTRDHAAEEAESGIDEFLADIVTVRQQIYNCLDEDVQRRLVEADSDVFIAILASAGYGFAVLLFAIYSIGAVAVPLSPRVLPGEAEYFLKLCDAALLTTIPSEQPLARSLSKTYDIQCFIFNPMLSSTISLDPPTFVLANEGNAAPINPDRGLAVLYTSGTSGLPKGVLHSRSGTHRGIQSQVRTFGLSSRDTWLHHSPVHWGAGFTILIACLISGATVEFCSSVFNFEWLSSRLERGRSDATCLYLPPSQLHAFADRLRARPNTWSQSRYEAVLSGLQQLRVLCTGGVPIATSIKAAWKELRRGKALMVVYAMTESMALVAATSWESEEAFAPACCGTRTPTVQVKVDGEGEICIRGPSLFKRYLSNNPNIMNGVFDPEGYFRTGDLGKTEGDLVYVYGRAGHDVIRVYAWRLYAADVESALSQHPLVALAIVLGVPHRTTGQQVAALLVTNDESQSQSQSLSLSELRKWLAIDKGLALSKLPTLLRVVSPHPAQMLPTTASGKPVKPQIRERFFNETEIESGRVECCDLMTRIAGLPDRPFDWAGIQASV